MNDSDLKSGLSIIIPVYNSETVLGSLLQRLFPVLDGLAESYEVILIDDGSRDDSWKVISDLARTNPSVRGVHLMRNYGQHNALLCGMRLARFDTSITIDDDLQHPPEEIPILLAKLNEGYDVVYGTPLHQQHGLWRNLASTITRITLQQTMGVKNAQNVSAFRAFRTRLRDASEHFQSPSVVLDVLLSWGTNHYAATSIHHEPRTIGESNYTFSRLILHAINMLTGFTVLPLQLSSLMGFLFALFGFVVFIYVIIRYLIEGGSVPGFPFLASIIAIFSGVQLFALGIIGEYLARMHFRIMERPSYVIREIDWRSGLNIPKNLCEILEWDSGFFDKTIARLNTHTLQPETLKQAFQWCDSNAVDCIYFLAESDDPQTIWLAEDYGFHLVEVRYILEKNLREWDPKTRQKDDVDLTIRNPTLQDTNILQAIARTSYVDSRYYFDPHFSEEKWGDYYATWVKKSCEGGADLALVAEKEGQVVGYITGNIDKEKNHGIYELTGVKISERRSGVGQELFRSGLDWYVQHSIDYMWVATQGRNIGTQRMIQRHGFLSKSCMLYYHKWFQR